MIGESEINFGQKPLFQDFIFWREKERYLMVENLGGCCVIFCFFFGMRRKMN